ncbi:hypothetical protein [Roseibium sp.]|uniref:hypothetical protein n=1 Tax=Roseibium sp. TaxID=1936156 RepID=UPI003D0D83B6
MSIQPLDIISWTCGLFVVVLFSYSRYNEEVDSVIKTYKNRIFSQFYVEDLTFRGKFLRYMILYIFVMVVIFAVVAVFGTGLLPKQGAQISKEAWPFFSALLVVGLVPLPWIKNAELRLRNRLHRSASMAQNANKLTSRLMQMRQDVNSIKNSDVNEIFINANIKKAFENNNLSLIARKWISSQILISKYQKYLSSSIQPFGAAENHIAKYSFIVEGLKEDSDSIIRQLDIKKVNSVSQFEETIDRASTSVGKLYDDSFSFCGCLLSYDRINSGLSKALPKLGFVPPRDIEIEAKKLNHLDEVYDIVLTAFFIGSLAAVFVYGVQNLIHPSVYGVPDKYLLGWPSRKAMSGNMFFLLMDLVWVGLICWVCVAVRARKINYGNWYSRTPYLERIGIPSARSYFSIACFAVIVSAPTLYLISIGHLSTVTCESDIWFSVECRKQILEYSQSFVQKEITKILGLVLAVILFLFGLEKAFWRSKRSRLFLKSSLIWLASFFCLSFYFISNESSGEVRYGFMFAYLLSYLLFWTIFLFLSWLGVRNSLNRLSALEQV